MMIWVVMFERVTNDIFFPAGLVIVAGITKALCLIKVIRAKSTRTKKKIHI